jgi:hypothetical protein
VDRDKLFHSIILTGLEDVVFPKTVVSVVSYLQEKRVMDFEWHQVAKKSWTVGQGSGKICFLEQNKLTTSIAVSSTES